MLVLTTTQYDMNKYEPIGLVSSMNVMTLSFLRTLLGSLAGIFGQDRNKTGIENKFEQLRENASNKLIRQATNKYGRDVIIVGTSFNITEVGNKDSILVCHAYGTVLKLKRNKSKGGTRKKTIKRKIKIINKK